MRQAALAHANREYARTHEILIEAVDLMDWANRPDWRLGRDFLEFWGEAAKAEQAGDPLHCAPEAWSDLAEQLADRLEREGDWISYLRSRWSTKNGMLCRRWRVIYGTLGGIALMLGVLILGTMAHSIYAGELLRWFDAASASREQVAIALLTLGRVLGSLMMVEHGFYWLRKAVRGTNDEVGAVFLPGEERSLILLP